MKIRTDFVTNSSSSSFVTVLIKTKTNEFEEKINEEYIGIWETDAVGGSIDSFDDLRSLIREVLSEDVGRANLGTEKADRFFENAKKSMSDVDEIVYIKAGCCVEDYEAEPPIRRYDYAWYSGKTKKWYKTQKKMKADEKEHG